MSGIQWTDQTWNPVVGCTPVSPGCLNCYAAAEAPRLGRMGARQYVGVTVARTERGGDRRDVFNGTVRMVRNQLTKPLRRKKPTRYFIASMGDLFHEAVPPGFIDRVFAVMALCPQHTFQVLTKRPERMAEYLNTPGRWERIWKAGDSDPKVALLAGLSLPLPNVWLGTSAEDQKRLDERVPHLLRCPAVVRFLSCEPLLGDLDLGKANALPVFRWADKPITCQSGLTGEVLGVHPELAGRWQRHDGNMQPWIDWVIVGGESGPQARFCEARWVRGIVDQCRAAGVPVFVKQLGSHCLSWGECDGTYADWAFYEARGYVQPQDNWELPLKDRKGGDPAEWPEDLRVREFPKVEVTA